MADITSRADGSINERSKPRTLLSEIGWKLFGAVSYGRTSQVVADIKVGIMVPANPNRISMILSNNSNGDIRIGLTADVSSTVGLLLAANGGTFRIKVRDEGEMTIHEWYAVGGSDGLVCTLIEAVLQGD